jgi:hypothetical protein
MTTRPGPAGRSAPTAGDAGEARPAGALNHPGRLRRRRPARTAGRPSQRTPRPDDTPEGGPAADPGQGGRHPAIPVHGPSAHPARTHIPDGPTVITSRTTRPRPPVILIRAK